MTIETIETFKIDKVDGTLTLTPRDPSHDNTNGLTIGRVEWSRLTINGKVYEDGHARIAYDYHHHAKYGFSVLLGGSFDDYTESARDRLRAGIAEYVNSSELIRIPSVEQINAEALEDAYTAGIRYAKNYDDFHRQDGINRTIRDWSRAYDAIFGKRWSHEYTMPDWTGVVSDLELKAEFLAAAQAEMARQLAKVEAALEA